MTPDELRALADEATPGPWAKHPEEASVWANFTYGPLDWDPDENYADGDIIVYDEGRPSEADACLIALAPDLARLCVEMAEALSWSRSSIQTWLEGRPHRAIAEMQACSDAALAKLSELGAPSAP